MGTIQPLREITDHHAKRERQPRCAAGPGRFPRRTCGIVLSDRDVDGDLYVRGSVSNELYVALLEMAVFARRGSSQLTLLYAKTGSD